MAETKKKRTTSSTAKSRRKPGRPAKNQAPEKPEFLGAEVGIIISFAAAVLLFLSNFHLCGVIGDALRGVQLGLFGSLGFIAPLLLFVGTCFYLANRGNPIAMLKMWAVIIGIIVICALLQMIFGTAADYKITEYYIMSSKSGAGGGIVGGAVSAALSGLLGTVGAYLVLFVLLAICVVLITEKSLVSIVKKGGTKACHYAKEDFDRRMEIRAEKQEERRRLREEQRVRGVNLGATTLEMEQPVPQVDYQEYGQEKAAAADEKGESQAGDHNMTPGQLADSLEKAGEQRAEKGAADVFTGKITMPSGYEDQAPFDEDQLEAVKACVSKEENLEEEKPDAIESLSVEEDEEIDEEIYLQKTPDLGNIDEEDHFSYEEVKAEKEESGVNYDTFFVPEEPKRVVTASGKVIETETELLKKKLEKKRAEAAEAGELSVDMEIAAKEPEVKKEYIFPSLDLLKKGTANKNSFSEKEYRETAIKLQQTLKNFGVGVTVTNVSCGPTVTRYELHPEQGVKVSKIVGLADDIKLNLAAADIRIEAPIPGKAAVGIEVPNKENNMVFLRDLLESEEFKKHPSRLAFAVGKDIGGQTVVADIGKMPHLLIAGATGSGKSVCINTLIMSVIYKSSPEDVKLIMVDPKVVELSVYNGIPHLLIPVVTDPKKASAALNWAVAEMTDRYKKFADYNVRDLKGYNEKIKNIEDIDDENKPKKLPQIVIIVDELADLMMVAPGEVEDAICRLAQLARAAGIHLVIATQRPSVNVITGLIKANVPSRIAFAVSSGVDSRTILDINGAEKLLGKGDMLFSPYGVPKPQRVQGAFVSDSEVQKVVDFLTEQGLTSDYKPDVESHMAAPGPGPSSDTGNSRDEYFVQAGKFIIEKEKASIGMLQRMFKIGFNRAARIMDQLAEAGVVGEEEGTKPRKVLMTMEEFDEMVESGL